MITPPSIAWPAPAKLNLFLHVLGRRADGYHELQTLFQFVDLCDEIKIALREIWMVPGATGDSPVLVIALVRFSDDSAASRNATASTIPRSNRLTRPSSGSPLRSSRRRALGTTPGRSAATRRAA